MVPLNLAEQNSAEAYATRTYVYIYGVQVLHLWQSGCSRRGMSKVWPKGLRKWVSSV